MEVESCTFVKMKKPHYLIAAALSVHAVAWALPVVKEGDTFPHILPGWQAFRVAACAIWPYEGFRIPQGWYNVILCTMSALTTVLFVAGSGFVIAIRSSTLRRISAWIAACAFIINVHWLRFGTELHLRIGYFLWWVSFLLIAIGLFRLSRDTGSRDS